MRARDAARNGGGADGKVIIERLCISLPYVETFNSKVIKGFVPKLRSRYVFFVFRDSYVLCIYVTNILCTFRVSISGYGTSVHVGGGVGVQVKPLKRRHRNGAHSPPDDPNTIF